MKSFFILVIFFLSVKCYNIYFSKNNLNIFILHCGQFYPVKTCANPFDLIKISNRNSENATLLFPGPGIPSFTHTNQQCSWKYEIYRKYILCCVHPGQFIEFQMVDPNLPSETKFGFINISPYQENYAEINLNC